MILYAGSYTQEVSPGLSGTGKGIYCFNFNENTGELKLLNTLLNRNTSYLAISNDKKYLYSFQEVNENEKPIALSFSIESDYTLKLINQQPIKGAFPCHLALLNNDKILAIACYGTGSVHTYAIEENGALESLSQEIHHIGKSINEERQEAAHAHMINSFEDEFFVPDLGIDAVVNYKLEDKTNQFIEKYKIEIPLGSGPRHLVFHPSGDVGFVMNELTGTVSVIKLINKKFEVINTVNSLPESDKGVPSGAAIKISKCGKFLYCSNRGSETITIFEFNEKEGSLTLKGFQDIFGKTPRDFSISPDGKWLLAANQDSNEIIVFKIDDKTGLLSKVCVNNEAQSVVCLKWL